MAAASPITSPRRAPTGASPIAAVIPLPRVLRYVPLGRPSDAGPSPRPSPDRCRLLAFRSPGSPEPRLPPVFVPVRPPAAGGH